MRKILLFALALVAGATFSTAVAGKKDKKKKAKADTVAVCCKPLQLHTPSDTVSYAAGYAATQGLLPYLQERLHVDTAYLADFVRGYREAIAKASDPAFVAYNAGATIAEQAKNQILPGVSRNLEGSNDSITAKLFHAGFLAGVMSDTTLFKGETANTLVQNKVMAAQKAKNEAYKELNAVWLKNNASKPGVVTLPSGLQYKVIKEGTGAKPEKTQTVEVVYEGKTIDGNVFDATSRHNGAKTDKFRCDQVIKGWTEALTNMSVGSKWELYIPQELAYGDRQAGSIKPFSTLIFTVELVGIESEAKPAAANKPVKKTATKKTSKRKK
mgnify:CR=1 FL=1